MTRHLLGGQRIYGYVSCFTLLSILALYYTTPSPILFFKIRSRHVDPSFMPEHEGSRQPQQGDADACDLFKGNWVLDPSFGPLYTNSSCKTIPLSKNCFLNGREDTGFLHWRWKPEKCELPRFEPKAFLRIVTGKKMAFIGDSVARNQVESLLCLLAQEDVPVDVFKDAKDRSRTWYFPSYNFTLLVLWTKFLVAANERGINGTPTGIFDLQLDKVDGTWANRLPQQLHYAVVSDSQWFFRKNYLYRGGRMMGCIYCGNESTVKELEVELAIGQALGSALSHINGCKHCGQTVTLVRTISPSHFENGTWKTGGGCVRARPLNGTEEVDAMPASRLEWSVREVQMQEVERARRDGEGKGRRYIALDVTWAMMLRPDGHPGSHWRSKQNKGYNDCVHWCMPGPIDMWNALLLAILTRYHH